MKTITEIALEIKAAFVANTVLQAMYSLQAGKTFDEQFAAASIEANLINVVATSMATMDWQQESYKEDVEALILQTFPGTVAWYHGLVLGYEYNGVQIIKYCAVVEQFPSLLIKVNGEDFAVYGGETNEIMIALRAYVAANKFAGTHISIVSWDADDVEPTLTVWLDAQKFNSSGGRLIDSSTPVEDAIDTYLASVVYNGTMNKSKLVDAIQAVDGVLDVEMGTITVSRADSQTITVSGNNYSSYGGGLVSTTKNITYVLG